jgi:hypothetical protein
MIKVSGNITIPKIDILYQELNSIKSTDKSIDILLPKKIEKLNYGVLFSLIQFLATWVRSEKSGKLCLPINNNEVIDYLNNNEFVYPSVVLSWEKEIIDLNGKSLKKELKNPSKKYFEKMEFFELKGRSVPLYNFEAEDFQNIFTKIIEI